MLKISAFLFNTNVDLHICVKLNLVYEWKVV